MADDSATELLPAADDHVAPPRPEPPAPGDLVGRTLGKFTILERLGRGGSGEVFRAEQVQLGRSAVIKVLRRDLDTGPTRIDRFLREARLASRLDHPYAAHIYAFGAEPDGVLWIAMEHVRGATLDELVARRGAIPPAVFGPLFVRLCEVVHTAHDLGVVHRDIKGSNVMVIERAGQLLPKLIDFGIAKATDAPAARGRPRPPAHGTPEPGDAHLTMSGSTLGSPHYMAPEQWRSAADVDARADIYALGVLAYRCVAGRLPFADVDRAGLADAHMMQAPPPLPASVPLATADVILRALAKEPQRRWPTALAFGEGVPAPMRRGAPGQCRPRGGDARRLPVPRRATSRSAKRRRPPRARRPPSRPTALRELVAITCPLARRPRAHAARRRGHARGRALTGAARGAAPRRPAPGGRARGRAR
ncbi:MAG: serine/threonine protein kinase [Deltaproteobacteria bacterium]|nr:serine/threonine protein kinase [Deltaproteobacteria bacterium]